MEVSAIQFRCHRGLTGARLLLVLAVALSGPAACRRQKPPPPAAPPPAVTVAVPEVRNIIEWDEFSGRLASPERVEIRARVSGHLDKVHFKEGTVVQAGELLFTIDPRPYAAEVARLKAEVDRTRTRVELAQGESRNAERLRQTSAISAEETERRVKALAETLGGLKAAEATLQSAELDLQFTEVRSPITGRISNARVTAGNLVRGGTQETTLLTTVVALDPIHCYFEVDERSALKYRDMIRTGQRASALDGSIPAEMGLANQPDFPHHGVVDFVDNQLEPGTGTIRARGVFPNPDRLMAPGFFARVRIPGSGEYQALLIRDQAVGDDQGRSFVWVIDDKGTAEYRPVTLGPKVDGLRIVRDGLKPDERIVINGLMAVKPGATVAATESTMALPGAVTAAPAVKN
jgi:RND family efflux transporter MFP subunit